MSLCAMITLSEIFIIITDSRINFVTLSSQIYTPTSNWLLDKVLNTERDDVVPDAYHKL